MAITTTTFAGLYSFYFGFYFWVFAVLVVLWAIYTITKPGRYNRPYSKAMTRLHSGDVEGAVLALKALAAANRRYTAGAASCLTELGNIELRRCNPVQALAAFGAVVSLPGITFVQPLIADNSRYKLALVYALTGDLDAAEGWLAVAERSRQLNRTHSSELAHVAIAARRRRYRDVIERIDEQRRLLESTESASSMRVLLAIRAFALSNLPGCDLEEDLALQSARSPFPKELQWLGNSWPEMHAFCVENKL